MELKSALVAFSSLSQETRLRVFKLLIEYGDAGAPAGTLSDTLGVAHNTLSFHLSDLNQAGLVQARKQGRQIIYTANRKTMNTLIEFLKENCCARDQLCSDTTLQNC